MEPAEAWSILVTSIEKMVSAPFVNLTYGQSRVARLVDEFDYFQTLG